MTRRVMLSLAVLSAFLPARATAQAPPDKTTVAVVVHVWTGPLFTSDGSPTPDRDDRLLALASELDSLTSADVASVPLSIAPSAVMCDEVMRLRGAAPKRFLRSLRRVAARSTVLAAPFANVRLVDLTSHMLSSEIETGKATIARCAGRAPADVVYPPDMAVNDNTLRAVRAVLTTAVDEPLRAAATLLPADVVPARDTPAALIARRRSSTVVAVTDLSNDTRSYVRSLATDPAIDAKPVDALVRAATPTEGVTFPSVPETPPTYRRALLHADQAFARFTTFTTPDNPLVGAYRDVLARARSSADMSGDFTPGRRLANGLVQTVAAAERNVSVQNGSITFTSRRGSVPVTVINRDPYPVRLTVNVESPKLDFPDGDSRVVTVQPPGDTITFVAVARSTGSFPMLVSVGAPDGSLVLDHGQITVRSTAANLPALAVTVAGFVLLIVFYVRRKKRRQP